MKITWKKEIKQTDKATNQEIIDIILKNRNIKDRTEFLFPLSPLDISLTKFGFKKELQKTLKLLEVIKQEGARIVVYTDYDADGITGGTILWETLHLLGFNVMPYVPHRKTEGYGFSKKGIDRVKKEFNPKLIISVDHGISGAKEITYATSLGIKIIVTDHHLKPSNPPTEAEAIFHIPDLSGSGVSYFFSKEIYYHFKKTAEKQRLATYFQSDYLTLATIGTIADMVPLVGPSRSVVYHGLRAFKDTRRSGIRHIIKEAGIVPDKEITPYEVGFIIAPRINAVGRLEHALDALRLLCTHNDKQAADIATKIGKTNKERQDLVIASVKDAIVMVQRMEKKKAKLPLFIILEKPDWNEGIIGLIASKIADTYSRPTIAMTKSDGFWKGSARSINDFHITNFLRSMDKYLISVGGHRGAAGFSIDEKQKEAFVKNVDKEIKKQTVEEDFEKRFVADLKIPLSKINLTLAKQIEKLAPFGIGNSNPTFLSDVLILEKKLFGKKSEHVKLLVKDAHTNSFPMELITFYKAEEFKDVSKAQTVSVIYSLDINKWNGRETIRGRIAYLSLL
ncbi:single-stranded-DNA-specific exonuclease RecJ [Candidatus Roizmanbacteria bacterium RIFOXYB2_FULL_38_10]|uniref:Single-stranded-DNA-specific exonuclease RecJ n=1 Tax=Candidatus Roizmanbacteria bacterium RIFOXYD1_FULL_38_12 TaxID=1802093 RepID=A0A1F7KZL5_9BACT|nr:MAG: single-stranded-DNA-specific exonuclease RecJ [Candidatus Roizmanbacteria bacterium RIFOXYA2_FULL_38_14]OGK63337.1 MAG: single-stranded-DNA-specific exonuclease RecJ [Candidatus Roizmanbacteria bacterium RIFOXYA1_FULL_37_12]OGK65183.1 MAG: single-stranded-DNA-specific exonuclease RecJ [Candidatus Roizmanbacteria bacterium RIFOXYB1_FULL_40_23]OGK68738.1 MAG: single-stranded-DNA-specific exonuclease RecJ [Candidatus Roizmanbacteria bacterium RIFOXYB2_FULL_38_10]OGK69588.1 MAG: single-stra